MDYGCQSMPDKAVQGLIKRRKSAIIGQKHYPLIEIDIRKLRHNIDAVVKLCDMHGIKIAGVVKGFNGILPLMHEFDKSGCAAIASSRLEHIQEARNAGLKGPFLSLRVPMLSDVPNLVRLCDMSLNSEVEVLKAINTECAVAKKRHGVIIMADLGDLREGFWDKDELVNAAAFVESQLENVHLLGVGTNLSCYGAVNPTVEKMEELVAIARRIEGVIGRKLEIISGGATTSLPLVISGKMPKRVNHLRIGECMLNAKALQEPWGLDMSFLHQDVFTVKAEIIEIKEKPSYPQGEILVDAYESKPEYTDKGMRKRALIAIGKFDVTLCDQFVPRLLGIEVLGGSSDHLILDITGSPVLLNVGDVLEFDVRYTTMLYTTGSNYLQVTIQR